jgi:intracellular sulfur oxidation DsrE/DsrF family protein
MYKKIALAVFASTLGFAAIPSFAADAPAAEAKSEYVKPNIQHSAYGTLKVVVPVTTDDKGIQGMKMRNITNGLKAIDEWKGKFEVTVVLYAKGLSMLKNPDEKTQKQIDMLRSKGVHFVVCNNSLAEQGVDFHKLYKVTDADVVPSGFAEVVYLQAKKHFVVDPMN